MQIDIRITGIPRVNNLLQRAKQMEGLKRGITASATDLIAKMREYPRQLPGTTYKRTNDLKKKWAFKLRSGGFVAELGNNVGYMEYVQGDKRNRYFRRVWRMHSVNYVVRKNEQRITGIVRNEIRKNLR